MAEGMRTIIGIAILVGIITFSATSGLWMFISSNDGAHSDIMTRCAIESLDTANDFALQEEWITAAKFIDMATGFLWRASWERDIEFNSVWNRHIMDLETDMLRLMMSLEYPYAYENKTFYFSFEIDGTDYGVSVENVTWAINKTIGELLPYSDIDPSRHPEYGGSSSNSHLWEKYKEYYKERPHRRILVG